MKRFTRLLLSRFFKGPIRIEKPRSELRSGVHRVSMRLDLRDIWFESSDIPLKAAPEAFATALLIPALRINRTLLVDPSVCPIWLHNQQNAARLVSSWWNYAEFGSPAISTSDAAVAATPSPAAASSAFAIAPMPNRVADSPIEGGPAALCFTGGVDSFYTLLRAQSSAEFLVFALGYDIDLRDRHRVLAAEHTIRSVAAETGKKSAIITSNIRRHGTFRIESWERTHGGALGALGHLLTDNVSTLQISASQPYRSSTKWGSHWDLDHLFASSKLAIQHFGAEYFRMEKLWQIAHEPIVHRYLRVCWERRGGEINCGQCEKCVRTMLALDTCGQLENYQTLGKRKDLPALVDGIPFIPWGTILAYHTLTERDMRPEVRRAVERLLERTRVLNAASPTRGLKAA